MTYLRPHSRGIGRGTKLWIGVLAGIAIAVAAVEMASPQAFPAFFTAVASPFWRIRLAVAEGALRTPEELLAENHSLRAEVADLQLRLASSTEKVLEDQNAELLSILGRASTTPSSASHEFKLAAVLERPGSVPYDELVLDLGSGDGVSSTSLVYSESHVLIGRVASTLARTSRAVLFSSPNERYDVLIGASNVPALAIGQGGGQYLADVPHGSKIAPGDVVIDSSLHDRAFGTVVSVNASPSNPFDEVLIASPVDVYGLRFVLVR